jgi:ABC-type molybdate transport system substrate-binding protein
MRQVGRNSFVGGAAACLLGFLAGVAPRPAAAWVSPVPDIVLYCTPAMQMPLATLAERFTDRSHVAVHLFVSPPAGLIGLLKHRARDDVVVADMATLRSMAATGLIMPPTLVALGRDPFVLVASSSAPQASVAQADALVAAHILVVTDATDAASFPGRAVLQSAAPPLAPKDVLGVADTPTVIATVRDDDRLVGLVNATEAAAPGLRIAAALDAPPAGIGAALVTLGQSGKAAALLAFIASPDGQAVLRAAGLAPAA